MGLGNSKLYFLPVNPPKSGLANAYGCWKYLPRNSANQIIEE